VDRAAHKLAHLLTPQRLAVVGAGWAGISAAVHARRLGFEVSVFEMAAQPGGRAREVRVHGHTLDNGQHILIGAYRATLELMHIVGADASQLLRRTPLTLQYPDGRGLHLRAGSPRLAFVGAVLRRAGWSWPTRLALLRASAGWSLSGFRCDPAWTVAQLCHRLPATLRDELIDPLCVAALNTPSSQASASVFLRVLRDALFGGPGSADLLLPRASLSRLLPEPATRWFAEHGVALHLGGRVQIGDDVHHVKAGDVVYIPGGVPHNYQADDGSEPFEFICVVPNQPDEISLVDC
jgi:predicted NAD/FAD-binding protein